MHICVLNCIKHVVLWHNFLCNLFQETGFAFDNSIRSKVCEDYLESMNIHTADYNFLLLQSSHFCSRKHLFTHAFGRNPIDSFVH